jgi:hypothetical protein
MRAAKFQLCRYNLKATTPGGPSRSNIEDTSVGRYLFLPHQANLRINQFAAHHLGVPEEKFYNNMQRYGNTTAASIPVEILLKPW